MNSKTVYPVSKFGGELRVPGDKSVSQRIAMLAALAKGTSEVRGFLHGEDAMSTLSAMCSLGASAKFEGDVLKITGTGGKFMEPANPLDMGNSGTGTRLLAGLLAGQKMTVTMTGDASLSRRPMGRIKTPLELMGAKLDLTGEKGTLPLTIHGTPLHGICYKLPMASAQVKSCVLLAGLFAEGKTTVIEPRPTRDHTEKLFQLLEIPLHIDGLEITLQGFGPKGPQIAARNLTVPGDFSSAAFWIAAVAARPGATLTVRGVGLNPRRTALLDVLKRMGALIEVEVAEEHGDPIGTVFVRGAQLRGTEIGGDEIPNLIDELPMLAVTGALAKGKTVIRDAAELRVKESDRIAVTAAHLRAFGVHVDEHPDGMTVHGPAMLHSPDNPLASHGDHRITMSMAMLATFSDAPVKLEQVECVATSYPDFWNHLEQLGGKVE
ncbi:MAG TPA: 3-phosphoshikimate 1-carboxyvinyltransferase [Pontiellaceae bacterium]|nr:3-phosphoshikimate 1-carboxyvinyltransferase [Pontiellaceae bacterium]HPR82340.1 3-phosphoshikimate 1-carboxyvinyltransferase [Pontiellaceae bacterium]